MAYLQRVRSIASLFTSRQIVWLELFSLLGRLQLGMAPLAILLTVRHHGGSLALAGAATGAHTLSLALTSPWKGRLIDRFGYRVVLQPLACTNLLCFAGLWYVCSRSWPHWAIIAFGMLSGATRSNLTSCMRAVWNQLHQDTNLRLQASALESTVTPIATFTGQLAVSGILLISNPDLALLAAAVAACAGTIGFARSPLHRPPQQPASKKPHFAPSPHPRLAWALSLNLPLWVGMGAVGVLVPHAATEHSSPAAAGAWMAVMAVGSFAGGLTLSSRAHRLGYQPRWLLTAAFVLFACAMSGLALAPGIGRYLMLLTCGIATATATACVMHHVGELAPGQAINEAISWAVTLQAGGYAAGAALAGACAEHLGLAEAFLLFAAAPLVGAAMNTSVRLDSPSEPPSAH